MPEIDSTHLNQQLEDLKKDILKNLSSLNPLEQPLKNLEKKYFQFNFQPVIEIANQIIKNQLIAPETLAAQDGASEMTDAFNSIYYDFGWQKNQQMNINVLCKELDHAVQPLLNQLTLENTESRMFIQMPGQCLPIHFDSYDSYFEKFNVHRESIVRYLVFVEDWDWGHHLLIGQSAIHQWRAGDAYLLTSSDWHCSGNMGLKPKLTLNITGTQKLK